MEDTAGENGTTDQTKNWGCQESIMGRGVDAPLLYFLHLTKNQQDTMLSERPGGWEGKRVDTTASYKNHEETAGHWILQTYYQ